MIDRGEDLNIQKDEKREQMEGEYMENTNSTPKEESTQVEELKRLLEEKEAELAQEKERVLRMAAELENFKKRIQREKEEYMKFALEAFAKELLPFLDNLERAIASAKENPDIEKVIEGLELTLNGYFNTLEKFGLKKFAAEGHRFDPNFHEALGVEEHEGVDENTVVKELLKGYTLHERVLRPALVVVSKKPQKDSGQTESDA